MSCLRGLGLRRNGPERFEAAEMIDPHDVEQAQLRFQALEPPCVSGLGQALPVINWVAPELTLRRKIIRGYARDIARSLARVEQKCILVSPDVGAVESGIQRHVAEQRDAASSRFE